MRNAAAFSKNWSWRYRLTSPWLGDPWLLGAVGLLLLLGLMMALNTTYFLSLNKTGAPFYLFERQLLSVLLGLAAMAILASLPTEWLKQASFAVFVCGILLLIAVWVPGLGVVRGGARRWLKFGPLTIEPAELTKLGWVFFLAERLSRYQYRLNDFRRGLMPLLAVFALLALITLEQPDFGATVVLALILLAMCFAAGVPVAHLGAAGGALSLFMTYQAFHKAYRARRLLGFAHPWETARSAGFQLVQSLIAIGAGGKWGVGLGAGRQKMFYLPQAHSDFVFAVVGEELGLAGVLLVVSLFGTITVRGMRLARRHNDSFASLLATGMTSLLTFQAVINMAVVTGLLPTKGLALPFLSYGGTAMVGSLAALGVLLNLSRQVEAR